MLFNSFQFLLFFPLVVFIYFTLPQKFRWGFLLIASCTFYMSFIPYYILILFFTIVVDYFAALIIERTIGKKKKLWLVISILSTCAVLAFFKYFYFICGNINYLSSVFHFSFSEPLFKIVLPIGLSFHTFQSLSYVIEVYRGNQKAEKHFGIYALYVMFFPQLVAGPIERPQNLLGQFYKEHHFDYSQAVSGLKLIAWGLFKKVVVADRLSVIVNYVYADPHKYPGFPLIFATIFFAFQIYADFSGYSDIARGCARILGFNLMVNFKEPYFSKSISEFWKRWHISLSTWFKDYLYIPLGGNRVPMLRRCFNLLITFSISGLWHGASWNFVIWGFLNGFLLCVEVILSKITFNLKNAKFSISRYVSFVSPFFTFFLICITWVFFRARTLEDALFVISHFFSGLSKSTLISSSSSEMNGLGTMQTLLAITSIVILLLISIVHTKFNINNLLIRMSKWQRWLVYYGAMVVVVLFGYFQSKNPFIYFQF